MERIFNHNVSFDILRPHDNKIVFAAQFRLMSIEEASLTYKDPW